MIQKSLKQQGKVTYYNKLTGIIVSNDKELPFHKKDIVYPVQEDITGKEVEFNLENDKGISYVRNIRIIDDSIIKK